MKVFDMRPAFHGYSASNIVKWYYDRAWNTMNGAKRAIVARTVDLYQSEIGDDHRTVKFNIPENVDDADEFLHCNKKNVKVIDDFFAEMRFGPNTSGIIWKSLSRALSMKFLKPMFATY